MGVYSLIKSKLFRKKDIYSSLRTKTSEFNQLVKKSSELLGEDVFFKKINPSQWQVIDTLKTQLAHSIVSHKMTIEDASESNYVFDLLKMSWCDESGDLIVKDKERFNCLSNGEIDSLFVNELSRLALEANGFLINSEDLKKK